MSPTAHTISELKAALVSELRLGLVRSYLRPQFPRAAMLRADELDVLRSAHTLPQLAAALRHLRVRSVEWLMLARAVEARGVRVS